MPALAASARRIVIYMFFDPQGRVDDYVTYKLRALREHSERIVVIVNGTVDEAGRDALESVADDVWERENVGFDVGAYREAQERLGWDALGEYDELLLVNYTFYGPIYPFGEVFERMDARDIDFWGLTDHEAFTHDDGRQVVPHLQSHWFAVRGRMLRSPEYRDYWTSMPEITSYQASIDLHEQRFTSHFEERGFTSDVAWPAADYPTGHPIFDSISLMLDDRLPIVKRRLFFHDPLYLDRRGIIGAEVVDRMKQAGYPLELMWRNAVRSAEPRILATNTQSMTVLPETDEGLDHERLPSIAVITHLYYEDLADEILDSVDTLPGSPRVIATTANEQKQRYIEERLAARGYGDRSEVRIVGSNRGRDITAFYVTCRDVLHDPSIDLIVKIHGKRSVQDDYNIGTWFRRHLIENLLHSPGYAANVVKLFQDDPTIGVVFPPVMHIGYPTLGHAWFTNQPPAKELADRLGITVPFDRTTPLAPFGSMFIARRDALALLAGAGFQYEDFPEEGGYVDGALSHVVERMIPYAAAQLGYRMHQVMNARMSAISYTTLEYKMQAVATYLPGYADEQVDFLHRMHRNDLAPLAVVKNLALARAPKAARAAVPLYQLARRTYHRLRGLRSLPGLQVLRGLLRR